MKIPMRTGFIPPIEMAAIAQTIVHEVKEYLIFAENESTKRADIEAGYRIEVARIEAARESLESFLDRSFEERRQNFSELFSMAREAMRSNDNKSLELSLSAITELAKISPLAEAKTLASLRNAMNNPDHEFQL